MDFNIAMVLKFASEGKGLRWPDLEEIETSSRILISGLGADELFSGYSRYRVAFLRSGAQD